MRFDHHGPFKRVAVVGGGGYVGSSLVPYLISLSRAGHRPLFVRGEGIRRDGNVSITVEPTDNHRSYHINSDKISEVLGFRPRHSIADAIHSICDAYRTGSIPDPLTAARYYNIRTMQTARVQ